MTVPDASIAAGDVEHLVDTGVIANVETDGERVDSFELNLRYLALMANEFDAVERRHGDRWGIKRSRMDRRVLR